MTKNSDCPNAPERTNASSRSTRTAGKKPETCPFPQATKQEKQKKRSAKQGQEKHKEAACKEVEEAEGWAEEISLDIEVSHATCQSCKIMLVEADLASFLDLDEAEKAAATLGATEISNSWGGPEQGVTAAKTTPAPSTIPAS